MLHNIPLKSRFCTSLVPVVLFTEESVTPSSWVDVTVKPPKEKTFPITLAVAIMPE